MALGKGVDVGEDVAVGVRVGVAVGEGVRVGVCVGVAVGEGVHVAVGVAVAVGVEVGVAVAVAVCVAVGFVTFTRVGMACVGMTKVNGGRHPHNTTNTTTQSKTLSSVRRDRIITLRG